MTTATFKFQVSEITDAHDLKYDVLFLNQHYDNGYRTLLKNGLDEIIKSNIPKDFEISRVCVSKYDFEIHVELIHKDDDLGFTKNPRFRYFKVRQNNGKMRLFIESNQPL